MTLLDYFAGQALAGYMAQIDNRTYTPSCGMSIEEWQLYLLAKDAEIMYQMAAAMLKERERINAKRD